MNFAKLFNVATATSTSQQAPADAKDPGWTARLRYLWDASEVLFVLRVAR